jgi:hypothetical protein
VLKDFFAERHPHVVLASRLFVRLRSTRRLSGTTNPTFKVGLKREVASLVGGFAPAIGAFVFQATEREFGPRGDIVVGQCVGYLGMCENRATVLTSQSPARHRLKSSTGSM